MRTVQPSPAATLRSASASGTRLLFVYGALLSPALLPSDRPWWRAECPDRRVEFRQKGGYATLEVPEEGMRSFCSPQPAQGIVVALSDADTEELQRREVGYDLLAVDVEVEVEDDEAAVRLAAEAFVCSWWHRLPRPVPPTPQRKTNPCFDRFVAGCALDSRPIALCSPGHWNLRTGMSV